MNPRKANNSDYRSLMNNIEMPSRVHDRIMCEAERFRAEEASQERTANFANRPSPGKKNPAKVVSRKESAAGKPARRRALARMGVSACAVALAGGLAFAVFSNDMASPNPTGTAPGESNTFALVAYADENPNKAPGETITFKLEDFGLESAWKVWTTDPEVNPNNIDPAATDGQRYLSVAYRFNLSCIGSNVESLTYTVEGDRMLFYTRTNSLRGKGEVDSVEERDKSFTVAYDEQHTDPTKTWRALRASFPLEGELADLYDTVTSDFYSGTRDWDAEANDRLGMLTLRRYADMLAQSRLSVTATFTDGSTQTKTYVIAPVDNLEEVVRSHTAALRAQQSDAFAEDVSPEMLVPIPSPQLFTLTELA